MKKLRLKALSLGAREILTREQLKGINGGCSSDVDCGAGYCYEGNCKLTGSTGEGDGSTQGNWCYADGLCPSYEAAGGAFCCCAPCGGPLEAS